MSGSPGAPIDDAALAQALAAAKQPQAQAQQPGDGLAAAIAALQALNQQGGPMMQTMPAHPIKRPARAAPIPYRPGQGRPEVLKMGDY